TGKPKVIIANTVKGKGVSFMENHVAWHGQAPSKDEYERAMQELSTEEVRV
ncbi:MAG: transketolase, partial [Bacilli bacterium]